jgi:hypothetical protein
MNLINFFNLGFKDMSNIAPPNIILNVRKITNIYLENDMELLFLDSVTLFLLSL